jgi:quercetin dioxygenase-like cupin family protein
MAHIVDVRNSEKYVWGEQCFGWHLLKREDLSVIQEEAASGKSEKKHFHKSGRHIFYIIDGEEIMEVEGIRHRIERGQGIYIESGWKAATSFAFVVGTFINTFLTSQSRSEPRRRGPQTESSILRIIT